MVALAGVRVTLARDLAGPRDYGDRMAFNEALIRGEPGDPASAGSRWGVTHLVVTPELLATYGVALDDLERRPYLRRLHLAAGPGGDYIGLFALVRPPS
jgi:hypothetical protein